MSNDLSTFVVQFTPAVTTELAAAVAEAYTLEDIVDTPTCEAAVAANARLSKALKALDEDRLVQTRKLDALKARAMAYQKEVNKEAVEAVTAIDGAINAYRDLLAEQARQRQAAAEAAEAAQREKEAATGVTEERTTAPLVAAELAPMEMPKIPTRRVDKVLIIDKAVIPAKYLVIDEKLLLADLKAGTIVPGASLTFEEVLVRR